MDEVKITQIENTLLLKLGALSKNINCIYLRNESHEMKYYSYKDDQSFEIDLLEAANIFSDFHEDKIYLIIEKTNGMLVNQEKLSIKKYNPCITNLAGVQGTDSSIFPYLTRNGFLQFTLADELPVATYFYRRHIDKLKITNDTVLVEGKFSTINSKLERASIVITSRLTDHEEEVQLDKTLYNKGKHLKTMGYKFRVDLKEELINYIQFDFDPEDVIDMFIQIKVQEYATPIRMKLGNPRILVENFIKGEIITNFNNGVRTLVPYFTLKGRNLSFKINTFSRESYKMYRKCLKKIQFPKINKEKIWVVGEKYYKAQDNGFHFFKYMREYHPDKSVYYIIDKNSNEYVNVKPYGNVIDYQSPEHFEIMLKADYICTTHHTEQIFPTSSHKYLKKVRAKRIFLQHGVLGVKNLTQIYGKQLKDFNVDLFITSSDREKQIVVRDLKYDDHQVKVTGLPRFDELFNDNINVKEQILIIPTWRDWLTKRENLIGSEYLERINDLLNSQLLKTLNDENISIVFCLHPNMQPFIDLFDVPSHVRSIKQGEVNVQNLIKESSLMITDYSSVAFDFSFLNKPVIYYQFDKNRFLGKYPSHLDIENEIPGIIVSDQSNLEKTLQYFYENDFSINKALLERIKQFNPFQDIENSKRIYNEIINFKTKNKVKDFLKYHILSQHLYIRFRKSKRYFKFMSWYNKFLTIFSRIDNDMIVIESNVGKSVADNPKIIYDEIKRQQLDYKIVWVNNAIYPFDDPNVISVERLSPSYFKYMSKAKFWINNQNFPYYIKKKKNTKYLQTWHGTPLKKMLNDVEVFEGRDKNYKQRVNTSISKWDYLVSPSPYATECFTSAFNFSKEILEVGYPRNDIFYYQDNKFIQEKQKVIRQRLGLSGNKKVILYAPTFRDDEVNRAKKHTINLQLDLHKMKENLGDDYVFLLRPHIIISNALKIDSSLDDFVINVAEYNEMSDLYLVSDICITDYSSVMFDFANTRKPLVFFTYDFDHYKNDLRGFYMDFENEAPGPLLFTNEQLIHALKNIEKVKDDYMNKYNAFYEKYCAFETGESAQKIVNNVLKQ